MNPGTRTRCTPSRHQRETVSAISMKRVSAIGEMRNPDCLLDVDEFGIPQDGRSRSALDAPGLSPPEVQQQTERGHTPDRHGGNVDQEIAHLGATAPSISLSPAAMTQSSPRTGRRSTGQRSRATHTLGAPL